MAYYQFRREQFLPGSLEEIWAFIFNPGNLKRITPDSMGFDITSEGLPDTMYEGMMIAYRVAPLLRIPTTWVTEITHVKKHHYFVDEQRVGPYKMWHHEHFLEATGDGVKMTDIVSYQPPFAFLGRIANQLIIRRKLEQIFDHRAEVLKTLFGGS
ncbi:MAG: SRPBCC family protein [Candidatus Marinimicrobia bacterium]|nr:SRPBCC family protein [Candidatus Neomarinimicrobiota bacterium]